MFIINFKEDLYMTGIEKISERANLTFIDEHIRKVEKLMNVYAINTDSYNEVFKLYKELIALKSELISQQERLIAIYKGTIVHLVKDDKGNEHIEPLYNNSEKSAYSEFLDSIDSKPYAEMREIKDDGIIYVPTSVKSLKDKFFAMFKKEQKEYEEFKQHIEDMGL